MNPVSMSQHYFKYYFDDCFATFCQKVEYVRLFIQFLAFYREKIEMSIGDFNTVADSV